jgi:hypothetical protein
MAVWTKEKKALMSELSPAEMKILEDERMEWISKCAPCEVQRKYVNALLLFLIYC